MASQGQIRIDTDLERPRPELVEAIRLGAAVQVQRDAGEDTAVPEAQRLLRERCGSGVVTRGGRLDGLVHKRFEDPRVEDGPAEADSVSASSSLEDDAVRHEQLSKPRHIGLETVRC